MVSYFGLRRGRNQKGRVLILIVMDNGLLLGDFRDERLFGGGVLILIVMDNGLLLLRLRVELLLPYCLNPYCNG